MKRLAPRAAAVVAGLLAALLGSPPVRAAPPVTFAALGDSTAVGVGAARGGGYPHRLARRLEERGIPVRLQLHARPGATIADVRDEQLPRVLSSPPALVTLGIGLVDVREGRSLREFARDLQVVADFLRRTKATVVVSTIPNVSLATAAPGAPAALARRVQAFNATLRTVAERHGFELADVDAATRGLGERPGLVSKDGLHPSAEGYERWAEAMWPTVERALAPRAQARRPAAR